jgi:hypothetical protein
MARIQISVEYAGYLDALRRSSGAVEEVEGFIRKAREALATKPLSIVEAELAFDLADKAELDGLAGAAAIAICMLASRPTP